jgi:hypothetical protein
MLNAIADDRPRNKLIADTAVKEMRDGNSVLVLSRRIKHLQNVRDEIFALAGEGGVVLLTGQLTKKLRKQIVEGIPRRHNQDPPCHAASRRGLGYSAPEPRAAYLAWKA